MAGELTNPKFRENAFTSAPLQAAGAYADGEVLDCSEFNHEVFECTYSRGAAGGAVKVKAMLSFDKGTTWSQTRTKQINAGAAGAEVVHDLLREAVRHTSEAAGAEIFIVEIPQVTATRIRISAAETGVVGTPGTFSAVRRASRNS